MDVTKFRAYGAREIVLWFPALILSLLFAGAQGWNLLFPLTPLSIRGEPALATDIFVMWVVWGILGLAMIGISLSGVIHGIWVLEECKRLERAVHTPAPKDYIDPDHDGHNDDPQGVNRYAYLNDKTDC